jgi:hypothetical protein
MLKLNFNRLWFIFKEFQKKKVQVQVNVNLGSNIFYFSI